MDQLNPAPVNQDNGFSALGSMYLSSDDVKRRWGMEDLRLATTLMVMDSVESWTFDDNPDIEAKIKSLCDNLEAKGNEKLIGAASHDFLLLLAYMSTTRALHILSVMDSKFSGSGLRLVQKAVELTNRDPEFTEGSLMVERLETLRRIRSLNRIFAPARLRLVMKVLEEIKHEN